MNIAGVGFHWLHIYVGEVRDAYNVGQGHAINPIHAFSRRSLDSRPGR